MSDIAIRVEGLGKKYRIGELQRYKALRDTLADALHAPFRAAASLVRGRNGHARSGAAEIWALKDVSFEVKRGEVVGIIGRNGAGKSTLLKILSRITEPTEGYAEIHGRVGSLLEVGTGFHPELTGRENIYLNGAILGMRQREIDRKFDEIVAFAEVEKFIDTPVKHYSSGMYMRLAFSVAAHLEPEILLVDEVLAVGDSAFQKKCLGKMGEVARQGRTVLFVSHNMPAILGLCTRAVLLDRGAAILDGPPAGVVDKYILDISQLPGSPLSERKDRRGNQALKFTRFELRDANGTPIPHALSGQDVILAFEYYALRAQRLRDVQVAVGIHGTYDETLFHLSTSVTECDFAELPLQGEILCYLPRLPLQPGKYSFNLFCTVAGAIADWIQNAGIISVEPGDFFSSGRLPPPDQGALLVPHTWNMRPLHVSATA